MCLYGKRISRVSGEFLLLRVRTSRYYIGILRLQGYRRNSALSRKRGIAIVSAEFGGKQSHDIGPRHHAFLGI